MASPYRIETERDRIPVDQAEIKRAYIQYVTRGFLKDEIGHLEHLKSWIAVQQGAEKPDAAWKKAVTESIFMLRWTHCAAAELPELIGKWFVPVRAEDLDDTKHVALGRLFRMIDGSRVRVYAFSGDKEEGHQMIVLLLDGEALCISQIGMGTREDIESLSLGSIRTQSVNAIIALLLARLLDKWKKGGSDAREARSLLCEPVVDLLEAAEEAYVKSTALLFDERGCRNLQENAGDPLVFSRTGNVFRAGRCSSQHFRDHKVVAFSRLQINCPDKNGRRAIHEILYGTEKRVLREDRRYLQGVLVRVPPDVPAFELWGGDSSFRIFIDLGHLPSNVRESIENASDTEWIL